MVSAFFLFTTFTIFALSASESARKIICNSSQTFYLNPDELHFIESQNFPKTMNDDCEMIFVAQNFQNPNNLHMIFVLTNAVLNKAFLYSNKTLLISPNINTNNGYKDFVAATNTTEIKFYTKIQDFYQFNAFQGLVMLDDWGSGCPLQSIAFHTPFEFLDDTEVFYLTSSFPLFSNFYDPQHLYHSNCVWKFVAPAGYKFKLVFTYFSSNNLTVTLGLNGKSRTINTTENITPVVYYYDTNFLIISYHEATVGNLLGFNGYLTVIKKAVHKVIDICKISKNGTKTIWTNFNMNGYPNNAECFFNFTIPFGKQIHITTEIMNIEKGVDIVSFYYREQWWMLYDEFILQSYSNELRNNILFKFISDRNVVSEGFKIIFEEFECQCNNPEVIVPCQGSKDYTIMEYNDGSYCGGFVCNFTIIANSTCPEKFHLFTAVIWRVMIYDEFNFYSNDKIYDTKHFDNLSNNSMLLSPNNVYSINFISRVYEVYNGQFIYRLTVIEAPTFLPTVIISIAQPTYALFMGDYPVNTIFSIEIDEELKRENDILELFSNSENFEYLTFYSDRNLSMVVEYIKRFSPNPVAHVSNSSYHIQNNQLTIHKRAKGSDLWFFRAIKSQNKNCKFTNSVFYVCDEWNDHQRILTNIADENGECEVILLNCFSRLSVWTTSKSETVKLFVEGKKLLFEFRSDDDYMWQRVPLFSYFYTIRIPSNASILLKFDYHPENIAVNTYPFKSVWTTANYGHSKPTNIEPSFASLTYNFDSDVLLTLTILEYNISTIRYVQIENKDYPVKVLNGTINVPQIFRYASSSLNIFYWQDSSGINDILIKIEAIEIYEISSNYSHHKLVGE